MESRRIGFHNGEEKYHNFKGAVMSGLVGQEFPQYMGEGSNWLKLEGGTDPVTHGPSWLVQSPVGPSVPRTVGGLRFHESRNGISAKETVIGSEIAQ